MAQKTTPKIIFIFLIILSFIGCGKGNTTDNTNPQTPNYLIKKWKYSDILAIAPGYPQTSIYTALEACKRDNYWEFKSDATFIIGEGLTKCKPTDPDAASTGTWLLFNSNTQITMTETGKPAKNVTVLELTANSLKLNYSDSIQGLPATITAILIPY
jgi:hypothetical protein